MKRITYISNFSRPLYTDEIKQIGEVSIRNNQRDHLTGALFCFRNIFYQILEGEEASVDTCFARISRDDRHGGVFTLQIERNIPERAYPDWSMKTVVLDENTDTLVQPIKNLLDSLSRTHRILEKYTSEFVRTSIQNGENPLLAQPKKIEAVVMFSDIVGSTTLSEFLPVEKITLVLDAYYAAATKALSAAGGDILKLTGDGFMARFPADRTNEAVAAALALQKNLQSIRANAAPDDPRRMLFAGIGITRGAVLEGNIGSGMRRDYTLLGDSVNTAARLEAVTRRVMRGLVFDDSVYDRLTDRSAAKKLGLYKPKGKSSHLNIYTLNDPALVQDESSRSIQEKLQSA